MTNNTWKDFITENEPTLSRTETNNTDTDLVLQRSDWMAELTSRAVLKVSGTDATEFLHGQFSNDLKQLSLNNWQLSSYSTPKGRLLAVFRIAKSKEDYYLEMPKDIIASFQKRLQMFVMRSAVTIENITDNVVICGFSGSESSTQLQSLGVQVPADVLDFSVSDSNDVMVLREAGETPRFVIIATTERMIELWQGIDACVVRSIENNWVLSQIENGRPDVFANTQEQFVAQMMNLHILDAVNFKKGCYPGQEVVARLQYLGKLKRRMYRFSALGHVLPSPGSEVFLEGESNAAGKVVVAANAQENTIELLAVLKVASVEANGVLKLASGEVLEALELPYTFEE